MATFRVVSFTQRDGGAPQAALVVQAASDAEGGTATILTVFSADGSMSTVEAVPAGTDVGETSGTFTEA